jgi:D-alanyl-lipoteichoic acid acyltransferase DltB (MBOAT superfamily)
MMTLLAWAAALWLRRAKTERVKNAVTGAAIAALAVTLICFKETAFFVNNINLAGRIAGFNVWLRQPEWIAPLGISYFTLILIGYLLDVRWGTVAEPQKNPLKMLLFAGYFPQLTSGPFTRYNDICSPLLDGEVKWDLERFQFGLQRFLWGLFKKLVIADRIAGIVREIYIGEPGLFQENIYNNGLIVAAGALAYTAQLYTDFSGCMDIVIGISALFGIPLAENFKRPFTSTSLSEIWRRWHITLGFWVKDYVLYPALKSGWMNKIREFCKRRFGKKAARDIPVYTGMFITWFCVGFWHGGESRYIFGSGLFFFIMIAGGLILRPVFDKLTALLRINTQAYSWRLFQRARSFCLFALSVSFGRQPYGLRAGFAAWKSVFTDPKPWVVFGGVLPKLGVAREDFNVIIFGLVTVTVVSMLQERYGSVRRLIAKQNTAFRWAVYLALLFSVLIFGRYGPGYNPADFIYGGF